MQLCNPMLISKIAMSRAWFAFWEAIDIDILLMRWTDTMNITLPRTISKLAMPWSLIDVPCGRYGPTKQIGFTWGSMLCIWNEYYWNMFSQDSILFFSWVLVKYGSRGRFKAISCIWTEYCWNMDPRGRQLNFMALLICWWGVGGWCSLCLSTSSAKYQCQ